jgi:hypothetical protein
VPPQHSGREPCETRCLLVYGANVIVLALTCSFLAAAAASTQNIAGRLNGTWKENEAKRNVGSLGTLRFQKNSNGDLEESRGSAAAPLLEPVHFDGKQYSIDQGRAFIAWKQTGSTKYERQIFEGGKLVNTRRIEINSGGKKMTETTDAIQPTGTTRTVTLTYTRAAGSGSGLEGRWKPESFRSSSPAEIQIHAKGTNTITVSTLEALGNFTATLDGTPAEVTGHILASGLTTSLKPVNANTIETSGSRNGVPSSKGAWILSPDGKTLTMSISFLGPNEGGEPTVIVYEKQ